MARGKERGNGPDIRDDKTETSKAAPIVPVEHIQSRILLIRGQKVILDSDLAELYGVPAKRLNEQVKRNIERFPPDFMFQLTGEETENLRSQFATPSGTWGGRRYPPYAFTEHGAIMAASVLNSPQAVQTSVFVVRAFVRLRRILASNEALATRLARLEEALGTHDRQIVAIVDALHLLMPPPEEESKEPFGFRRAEKN
jgi:hypothetical protein